MIPRTDGGRKTATDPEGGVRLPGQWYCSTQGPGGGGGNAGCYSPTDDE